MDLGMDLLAPHHDGSPAYVVGEPRLGGQVTLVVRTSTTWPVTGVWCRSTPDGEPHFDPAVVERRDEHTVWWRMRLTMRNPVQRYRFMIGLAGDDGPDYVWLNGAGVVDHDTPDSCDFVLDIHPAAPDWGRDAVVYQIFPDRFARSAAAAGRSLPDWAIPAAWDDTVVFRGPETPVQLFGGDLDGIAEHLDHVSELGATTVYLTPVFPAGSNHRYDAATFLDVDPVLGGDAALERLVAAVHDRGLRIMGDLTTNHTGDRHEWFRTALADPESRQRSYYYFQPGSDDYEGWFGVRSLPKLDHTDAEMRGALVEGPDSVVARWLRPPYCLDGWRIDVANMTGRRAETDVAHQVARAVRDTAVDARPDALVLAEHGHDASEDLGIGGWHGTMNYYGFSKPVWSFLRDPEADDLNFFGVPIPMPRRPGPNVVATMREFLARYGWRSFATSWNICGSHDTARIRTVTGSPERQRVAAGLQFTLPGVPMMFAGDEIGLEGTMGEDSRRTMPWDHPERWDRTTLEAYAGLARLRAGHEALRRGGLRWAHVGDDSLVFLREHPAGSVLVALTRGGGAPVSLPAGPLGITPDGGRLLFATGHTGAGRRTTLARSGRGAEAVVEVPLAAQPSFAVYSL